MGCSIAITNELVEDEKGIWMRQTAIEAGGFGYSDGDDAEQYLRSVLEEASDLSSTSLELETRIRDWPSEYHLSVTRGNLVRALDLGGVHAALELGCGCGAITRVLGEYGITVDAVEGSYVRAELARLRCKDLENVNIVNANFNELAIPKRKYDVVLMVGVVEYAKRFLPDAATDEEAATRIISMAMEALTDNGVVLVAIENRTGYKYMAGATEDHYGVPYIGIYQYPDGAGIKTYSKKEWAGIMRACRIDNYRYFYPFPDYKVPSTLLCADYVERDPYAYSNLYSTISRDYHTPFDGKCDEFVFWEVACQDGNLGDYANSYLIVAGKNARAVQQVGNVDFAHFANVRRKPAYRTMTVKRPGQDVVTKRRLGDGEPTKTKIEQVLGEGPYCRGQLLSSVWRRSINMYGSRTKLEGMIDAYYEYLSVNYRDEAARPYLLDLITSNIVVGEDGEYRAFDTEWRVNFDIPVDYVLFRALLYFTIINSEMISPFFARHGYVTRESFIKHQFERLGLEWDGRRAELLVLEASVQSLINRTNELGDTERALTLRLDQEGTAARFRAVVYWADEGGGYAEVNSQYLWGSYGQRNRLEFKLPQEVIHGGRKIRFDPAAEPGFYHIYHIAVVAEKPDGESQILVNWTEPSEIVANAQLVSLKYGDCAVGAVFEALNDDPQIIFDIEGKLNNEFADAEVRLVVEMDWPKGRDYLVAKNTFIREEGALIKELRRYEQENERLRKDAEELAIIKSSKVWRLAEAGRRLVYIRLLGRLPRVKRVVLGMRRLGPRRFLGELRNYAAGKGVGVRTALGSEEFRGIAEGKVDSYRLWLKENALTEVDQEQIRGAIGKLKKRPKISVVVPVYNTDSEILGKTVASVREQLYGNWEMCLVDDCSTRDETVKYLESITDPRIHVKRRKSKGYISGATNTAIGMAGGEYIAFLDHDDELSKDALYEVAKAVAENDAEVIYSDEDFINEYGTRVSPHFKPDYSPDLLLSHNYITHLLVVKKALLDRVGRLNEELSGAQDYDLILRLTEKTTKIHHIPKILYHWRQLESSTSKDPEVKPEAILAGKRTLELALERRGIRGSVHGANLPHYYRVKRDVDAQNGPCVSIIIPFNDKPDLLKQCLDSILGKTTYKNFEIICVSNNSEGCDTFTLAKRYAADDDRVKLYEYNIPFNFSKLVNYGVKQSSGEHIVLMNNDIEIITYEWIEGLLEHSLREEVAAVGAKLYYPNDTVQHAGIVIGLGGYAAHALKGIKARHVGYFNRVNVVHDVSAVTGALMMVKRRIYDELGGFDEDRLGVAFNDVDFCLRAMEQGYLNIFTPYVEAYHHESISRGYEDSPEKQQRFSREKEYFSERFAELLTKGDPYYNPNLTLDADDYSLRF